MPLIKSASRKAVSQNIREMEAAGRPHNQAVAAALRTADEAKHGSRKMKKDVMDGSAGMSPRKAMGHGMGEGGGNFGVESFEEMQGHTGPHPDHVAKTGTKMMEDHERGIGRPVHSGHHSKGHHLPAQAAPDHGMTHPGGHGMKHYGTKV